MVKNSLNRIIILSIVITLVMLSGCTENDDVQPDVDDNVSKPDSGQFIYGNAVVENIDIMILESFPVQVMVSARGYLPDGCTEIDTIDTSKEGNTFTITITTVRPSDAICTQAIVPFEENIPLNVQGLKAGIYAVNVNEVSDSFELQMDNFIQDSMVPN